MEYHFPKQIYPNHTLAIIVATSLLPERVSPKRLDRYACLAEVYLPMESTAT